MYQITENFEVLSRDLFYIYMFLFYLLKEYYKQIFFLKSRFFSEQFGI